ncbi:MATE family efflux transporter [Chitinibacter sp. S2-10]|uniref:MATE family efflux transporter n=1 Tax=Chitinibacter sp. S2-10 TaxID=3373597 RepID=UPI003977CF3A
MKKELYKFYALAIPVTMQLLFLSARNIADILMTSSLGMTQVAAVGISGKAIMVGLVALGGLVSGCSVLGAQYWGEQNIVGLRKSVWLALATSSLFVLLPILILFTFAAPHWLSLASQDAALIANAAAYLQIFAFAFVFLSINNVAGIALRVSGRASMATYASLIGVLLNVLLSYVLIFGIAGFAAQGILGAAWGTVISAAVESMLLLGYFLLKGSALLPRLGDLVSITRQEIGTYTAISIPATINGLLWALGIFIYSMIYGRMGTASLAVMASLTPLESISAAIEQGLATATAILLGNTLGQARFDQAKTDGHKYLKYSIFTSITLGVLLLAVMPLFLNLFRLDGDKASIAISIYMIMVLTFWVKTINAVGISGVLRSGGDVGAGLKIDLIGQWGIGIPLAMLGAFVFKFSLPVIFVLVMLEDISKAMLTRLRIKQYFWLRKVIA